MENVIVKNKSKYYISFLIITLVLIIADQVTKFLATAHLMGKEKLVLINGFLSLEYLEGGNTGAAWGIFSGKITMFVFITVIAIVVIGIFARNIVNLIIASDKKIYLIILFYVFGILTAGAVGNLIDRVVDGYVVDFICFDFINFPTFNVADCYVTVSAFMIILLCLIKLTEEEFNRIFTLKKIKRV